MLKSLRPKRCAVSKRPPTQWPDVRPDDGERRPGRGGGYRRVGSGAEDAAVLVLVGPGNNGGVGWSPPATGRDGRGGYFCTSGSARRKATRTGKRRRRAISALWLANDADLQELGARLAEADVIIGRSTGHRRHAAHRGDLKRLLDVVRGSVRAAPPPGRRAAGRPRRRLRRAEPAGRGRLDVRRGSTATAARSTGGAPGRFDRDAGGRQARAHPLPARKRWGNWWWPTSASA